jgi:hypothetical protein
MYEDSTMYSGDRYVAGLASRDLKSNPMTLNSLFNGDNKQNPNKINVQRVIPAELTNISDLLESLFLSCDQIHNKLVNVGSNPSIKRNNISLQAAKYMVKSIAVATKKLTYYIQKLVES